jgi:hypothetical protein
MYSDIHSLFIYGTERERERERERETETHSLLMRIQNVSAWWSLTVPYITATETEGGHIHR